MSALKEINERSLVHHYLKLSWFVEIMFGGSVCLILALALAMRLMQFLTLLLTTPFYPT
jgi:hypothetical protein